MQSQIFRTLTFAALLAAAPLGLAQEAQRTAQEGESNGQQLPPLGEAAVRALNEAIELMNAESYEEAKELLTDLDQRRLSPFEIGRVEQLLAQIAFEQEDFATARTHFQKAIDSGGVSEVEIVNLKFQIAQLFFADELYDEAIVALEEWFSLIESPNAQAYYLLAVAYYQNNNQDKALENVRKAVDLSPEPQESHLSLLIALLMEREEYEEAKDHLNRILALVPSKKNYWLQLSSVYSQMENYEEALATIEIPYVAGMLDQPNEIRRYADLLLFNQLGYRCGTVLEKGIADGIVEDNLSTHQKLADCWLQSSELERAAEVLGRIAPEIETGKDYVRLGEVQRRLERYEEAARAFESGINKGGLDDVDRVELLMGYTLFVGDEPCSAIPWFERARSSTQYRDAANGYIGLLRDEGECR
jgi:tetratricopeptide (TPR) repeat protein